MNVHRPLCVLLALAQILHSYTLLGGRHSAPKLCAVDSFLVASTLPHVLLGTPTLTWRRCATTDLTLAPDTH